MRLIDADTIFNGELLLVSDKAYDAVHAVIERINNAPTVDAVPVVRCKDCYYCATEKSFGKVYHYCEAFEQYAEGDLIGVSLQVNPDHFCSWGERREDGTN